MSKLQAGDQSNQALVENGTVVFNGHTYGEIRQIAIDVAKAEVLPAARAVAAELIEDRVNIITDMVLRAIMKRDSELLRSFSNPRFLAPLVSAQKSYAETGDDELGSVLSGLLTSLASEPIRTRKEIVLREAIECAPKLTSQHLGALSAILLIQRFSFQVARNLDHLLEMMDEFLQPYYRAIPNSAFELQYMAATPAGSYLPFGATTVYKVVRNSHPQALYDHIDEADLKENFDLSQPSVNDELRAVLAKLPAASPEEENRFKIKVSESPRLLSDSSAKQRRLNSTEQRLREIVLAKSVSSTELSNKAHANYPQLAEFLDTLESCHAVEFQLSPVGMMLARHEIVSRTPELANDIDSIFND